MKMFYEAPMGNLSGEEMLEKIRIREIVEYDRYCTDYGLKEQQRALWHEDGRLFTTWFEGSINDYLGNPTIRSKELPKTHQPEESHGHRINNTVVWLNGEKAVAEVLCFLNFRTEIQGEWMDSQCWCRMHYRLERRADRWGILYFEGIYEKTVWIRCLWTAASRSQEMNLKSSDPLIGIWHTGEAVLAG